MRVRDLLQAKQRAVISTVPAIPVTKAMALMIDHQISCLPVLDEEGRLLGIISDKDIFRQLHKDRHNIDLVTVGELMTTDVIVGVEEDEVSYMAGIMTKNRIRHIPILKGDQVVGLVSVGDIVKTQMSNIEIENRYLWQYINGSYPG
ncbi:MAG: CBS domain-containing protein [Candidatus Zixiibacteriota bacterium]